MNALLYVFSFIVAVLIAAIGELVSDEIRARLDRMPLALLAAAARRLPPEQRDELYGQAWLPELRHILQGDEATPITRLIHGVRYALRLWLSAPQIGRELIPGRAATTLSKRMLQFVFAPTYVVAANSGMMPFASVAIAYTARQPSWLAGLFAAVFTVDFGLLAIFGRRLLIRRHGYVPSREMLCQCIFSTTIRSLVVPLTVAATGVVTILVCQTHTIPSSLSVVDPLIAVGFVGAHSVLLRLGFRLRVRTSE
jgi:hypothetical protein